VSEEDPSIGLFNVTCASCQNIFPAEDGKCTCGARLGDLKLDIDKMLGRIYDYHVADKDDRALDVIFDVFWHLHAKFDIMNEILTKVDLTKVDEGIMVCFMIQTFKYSKQVPAHVSFCIRVAERMKEIGRTEEDIHDLVDNYMDVGNYWESMAAYGAPEWLSGPNPNKVP
jgi:hypothetical protein